jgi:hypothetical protein
MDDLRNFGRIRLKWVLKKYCQSVGCRDRFGTECRAVNRQQLDRPRTCNVPLRRVTVTIIALEKRLDLHTLCRCL